MLKPVVVAALVAAALSIAPRAAEAGRGGAYPWCANMPDVIPDCNYMTFAQCQVTVRGVGGTCDRNIRFRGYLPPQRRYLPAWPWFD